MEIHVLDVVYLNLLTLIRIVVNTVQMINISTSWIGNAKYNIIPSTLIQKHQISFTMETMKTLKRKFRKENKRVQQVNNAHSLSLSSMHYRISALFVQINSFCLISNTIDAWNVLEKAHTAKKHTFAWAMDLFRQP